LAEGNNSQLAKNKIYDAFAAILGRGKAKSKESKEAKKGGNCFIYEM
jgi:hypothetical protein